MELFKVLLYKYKAGWTIDILILSIFFDLKQLIDYP